jgi:hypothetical protein
VLTGLTGSGDYNNDNVVDAADYTVWREMLGQSGTDLAADGTYDGTVDEQDYNQWKATFGVALGAGSGSNDAVAVPEPTASAAAVIALVAGIALGRRYISRRSC